MVPLWTSWDSIRLIGANFYVLYNCPLLRDGELQIEGFGSAFVERETRRGPGGALEPRRVPPFALRDVFDGDRQVIARRQIGDLELALLIGAPGVDPAAVR